MLAKIRFKKDVSEALQEYGVKRGNYPSLLNRTASSLSSGKGKNAIRTTLVEVFKPDQYDVIEIILDIQCLTQEIGEINVISEYAKNLKNTLTHRTDVQIGKHVVKIITWL